MNQKRNWQNFLTSLLFIIIFPLIPLFLELMIKKDCPNTTLAITAAIYCVTVLTASNNFAWMFFSILPSVLFSSIYASLLSEEIYTKSIIELKLAATIEGMAHSTLVEIAAYLAIVIIAFIHTRERYIRHVKESEAFLPTL